MGEKAEVYMLSRSAQAAGASFRILAPQFRTCPGGHWPRGPSTFAGCILARLEQFNQAARQEREPKKASAGAFAGWARWCVWVWVVGLGGRSTVYPWGSWKAIFLSKGPFLLRVPCSNTQFLRQVRWLMDRGYPPKKWTYKKQAPLGRS